MHDTVRAFLLHLLPPTIDDDPESDFGGMFYDYQLPDAYYNEDADHVTHTPGNVAWAAVIEARGWLRNAALVSRLWFSIAVPLLWTRPADDALGLDNVTVPARRKFYARYIRHVSLTQCSTLWRALAEFGGSAGVVGYAHPAGLRLPRLSVLNLPRCWLDDPSADYVEKSDAAREAQRPLIRHIGMLTKELSCHLSAGLIDRLDTLRCSAAPPQRETHTASGQLIRPKRMQLSRLLLYGRPLDSADDGDEEGSDGRMNAEVENRLFLWLVQASYGSPELTSVRLISIFCGNDRFLLNRVFRHFAFSPRLRQLWLGNEKFNAGSEVSEELLQKLAREAGSLNDGSHGSSGRRSSRKQAPPSVDLALSSGRRPFAELLDLLITVRSRAMRPLAALLPAVTILSAVISDVASTGVAERVLPACAALPLLQILRLRLSHRTSVPPASFRALRALTQLRELSIVAGSAEHVEDDDLAYVLRAMPHLRTLVLRIPTLGLSMTALRAVGAACPTLRRLDFPTRIDLAATFSDEQTVPLFRALEFLSLGGPTVNEVYNDLFEVEGPEFGDER
jgi:hypothetical protein